MKLLSFVADGKECFGAVSGDGVVTLNDRVGHPTCARRSPPAPSTRCARPRTDAKPDRKLADIKFLPVIPNPHKILCAGVNYRVPRGRGRPRIAEAAEHVHPLHRHAGRPRRRDDPAEACRTISISKASWPSSSARAAAISRSNARSITSPAIRSSSTAACATIRNSPSPRARIFPAPARSGRGSSPRDEIPDPSKLTLTTRLNGQQVQHSGTDKLIYSIPQIVAFCSDFTALSPGDVIATGTPEGVGHSRKPPLWMKPGDVLEVEITGIGTLRARIVDENVFDFPSPLWGREITSPRKSRTAPARCGSRFSRARRSTSRAS